MKFQDRFISLELDLRQRDEVISQLQHRIQELEQNPSTPTRQVNRIGSRGGSLKSITSGSSVEIPFVVSPCINVKRRIFSNFKMSFSVAIQLTLYSSHHHHPNTIGLERK